MPKRLEMFSIIRRSASVTVSMFVTSLRVKGLCRPHCRGQRLRLWYHRR